MDLVLYNMFLHFYILNYKYGLVLRPLVLLLLLLKCEYD